MRESSTTSPTPIPERGFHLVKKEYGDHSIDRALESGQITKQDALQISSFVVELSSSRNISAGRVNKIIFILVNWRTFLGPYSENTIFDIYRGITRLKQAQVRGHPYKQNTIRDYVLFLKRFYRWLIENGASAVPRGKIDQIHAPACDTMTKISAQLLDEEEVLAIIRATETRWK